MPYIKQEDRTVATRLNPRTPGELNYAITMLAKGYIESHGLSYQTINDIDGAMSGASKEFYRRIAAPYENLKCRENGDVFTGERNG